VKLNEALTSSSSQTATYHAECGCAYFVTHAETQGYLVTLVRCGERGVVGPQLYRTLAQAVIAAQAAPDFDGWNGGQDGLAGLPALFYAFSRHRE
jgi:hypothetical protein